MQRFFLGLMLLCICFTLPVLAQDKPFPEITADHKVEILQAQHKLDDISAQMANLNSQFQTLQQQAKTQFETLQAQLAKAKVDLDAAVALTFKTAGVDPTKADLPLDTLKFVSKKNDSKSAKAETPPTTAQK